MTPIDVEALARRWVHSYEEDSAGDAVYRPSGYDFPPARGRRSFELRPDGTLVEAAPGPVDAPVETGGTWALEGETLLLHGREGDRALRIASVDDERLVLAVAGEEEEDGDAHVRRNQEDAAEPARPPLPEEQGGKDHGPSDGD
jgi:hypothetical protein